MLSSKLCLGVSPVRDEELLRGKRVLLRAEFNVPLDKRTGKITNGKRIEATLPTIRYLLKEGKCHSVAILSHLGRPGGRRVPELSLAPIALHLQTLLQHPVLFLPDCVGDEVERTCANAPEGSVILLENVRFHAEEEGKQEQKEPGRKSLAVPKEQVASFRASLTRLGEVYVNDAFGAAHRAHSSMVGINLPIRAAGLLLSKELEFFGKLLERDVKRPFVCVLGGAKVADKLPLISRLLDRVDELCIGGGMAYTFLRVLHPERSMGDSLFDEPGSKLVPEMMAKAERRGVQIHLPVDFLASTKFSADAAYKTFQLEIPPGYAGMDIGPETAELFAARVLQSGTVLQNGPLGVFEFPQFERGTKRVMQAMVDNRNGLSVVGGGDSAAAAFKFGFAPKLSHVSTGGGATLELLEGKTLPGIAALSDVGGSKI